MCLSNVRASFQQCGRLHIVNILSSVVVEVYLFRHQQAKHNKNEFHKAVQPEGQMPIMLATYSTSRIIYWLKRYVNEQINIHSGVARICCEEGQR